MSARWVRIETHDVVNTHKVRPFKKKFRLNSVQIRRVIPNEIVKGQDDVFKDN